MKLTYKCPICDKQLKLKREFKVGDTKLFEYTCDHIFSKEQTRAGNLDFTSVNGNGWHARPYQEDGIRFIVESDFNCIVGDQMRLGKTPQILLALKNRLSERTPCLILVKSANLWQWVREFKTWTTALPNGIFPIIGSQAWIPPGFSAYICPMDTFAIRARCKCGHSFHKENCVEKDCGCRVYNATAESVLDKLKKIPFKLVIADEAHSFKNTDSNRSQALVDFINYMNIGEQDLTINFDCTRCKHKWSEQGKVKYDKRIGHTVLHKQSKCTECGQWCYIQQQHHESEEMKKDKPCGVVLLTGTPILNRAEEYFVPLNLVNPEKFSSLERFRREWLEQDYKGRWSRVKPYALSAFKETIAPNFLRREKEDVFTDLPAINRIYTVIEPPDLNVWARQYNKVVDKLEMKLAQKANITMRDTQAEFMELRRICGMMKLMWTADYLESCAMDSKDKYAIGIHHETVRDVLYVKLGGEPNCFKLSGLDDSTRKDWIMRNWEHSNKQFLIINMLAGGVGMDFHYCDNVLVLERQWNAETEKQFEFRFYNPDKAIKSTNLTVEYILVKDSFEQKWHDMICEKAANVGEVVYNNWDMEADTKSFHDLVESVVAGRMKG